jgi:hypothetical protein
MHASRIPTPYMAGNEEKMNGCVAVKNPSRWGPSRLQYFSSFFVTSPPGQSRRLAVASGTKFAGLQ